MKQRQIIRNNQIKRPLMKLVIKQIMKLVIKQIMKPGTNQKVNLTVHQILLAAEMQQKMEM